MPTCVGTPVNLKAVVAYTFCTALNDCSVQKQWRIRPPQEPVYKVSLSSAPWLLAQAGDLFSPSTGDFSFRSCLPPALSFSFAYARCIIRAQTTHKTPLLRLSHRVFVRFTDAAHTTWFFFFLSLLAISAWFYTLSHSDISEENLFFH